MTHMKKAYPVFSFVATMSAIFYFPVYLLNYGILADIFAIVMIVHILAGYIDGDANE